MAQRAMAPYLGNELGANQTACPRVVTDVPGRIRRGFQCSQTVYVSGRCVSWPRLWSRPAPTPSTEAEEVVAAVVVESRSDGPSVVVAAARSDDPWGIPCRPSGPHRPSALLHHPSARRRGYIPARRRSVGTQRRAA